MTALPPSAPGAVHESTTIVLPGVADSPVGAPGTRRGVPAAAADHAPVPATLMAATRTSYAVPLVRPVRVRVVASDTPSATRVQEPEGRERTSIV